MTSISMIFDGCRQNMVSGFLPPFAYVASGCAAPVLLLVFTISKGPLIFRLKVISAFVLFV